MNVRYNEIALVYGKPAIMTGRDAVSVRFARISPQIGVTGDTLSVINGSEDKIAEPFGADTVAFRKIAEKHGLKTIVDGNMMHVKAKSVFSGAYLRVCDLAMSENNREIMKITNIRPTYIRKVAEISILLTKK